MSNNQDINVLSDMISAFLDCEISDEEFEQILKEMKKNSSPGSDGLPIEFYIVFWLKIKSVFIASIKMGLQKGCLSVTQREGLITLLPKKDKDTLFIKNWRPLSLLNVDYKILAKCLANRIKKHIDFLIHHDQTGFIKGRFIGENINKILSIMEHCDTFQVEAMIVNIDFEKAFDSIEWSHLDRTLQFFNFGPNFRSWVRTLYNESFSKVLNNGWASDPIKLSRGLRQGCPLSSFLFILVAEILANKIRINRNIKGITIDDYVHKVCQYADDTEILLLFDESSLRELLSVLDNFETVSGLKVNSDKTEIMKIGKAKNCQNELLPNYKFKWTNNIKTLGIDLLNDLNHTLSKNYTKKTADLKNIMYIWSQRQVTMYGKILLSKTLLISQFNFLLACLPSPSDNKILELDKKIMQFIRSFKSPQKLSKDILQLDKNKSGLNVTLLKDQAIGMKISWVVRLISNENQSWKKLVKNKLPLKHNQFWACNFNEHDCKHIFAHYKKIPFFWKDVIVKWAKYNFIEPTNISSIISQPLWFNSCIKNANNSMIYMTKAYDSGIFNIHDLLINNKLATFEQISSKYPNSGLNFLSYYGLINAIPRTWKQIITSYFSNPRLSHQTSIKYNALMLAQSPKICSKVVQNMRNKSNFFPEIAYNKWQTNLGIEFERDDFLNIFKNMYSLTKDAKLLYFKYRLLHRNVITNRNLNLWDSKKPPDQQRSPLCSFCNREPETIEHLLYDCFVAKALWNNFFLWIFQRTDTNINFSRTEILLGVAPVDLEIFNLMFMIITKYIYDCRCLNTTPNIFLLKYKISQYYTAEKLIAEQNNSLRKIVSKWEIVSNCFS